MTETEKRLWAKLQELKAELHKEEIPYLLAIEFNKGTAYSQVNMLVDATGPILWHVGNWLESKR